MDILLVTSSFNDEIHGSDDKKKTGCGIALIKPENISKYHIGGVMTDLKEISCDKCKERLAKKIIKSDKKEMAKLLKEERARAKKGIEDEGIIPLGNTTAKITKSPEQRRQEEEAARAEAARKEAEEARKAAEEAKREAEEAARKAEEEAEAARKNIPGTDVAMDSSLAQFAINVPHEKEPEPVPVQDDFLAQFAIQKPDEKIQDDPEPVTVQDDFLAQFAISSPHFEYSEPEYMSSADDEDGYVYEDTADTYDNDDSVINVSEDEMINTREEISSQPAEEQEFTFDESSDWDFVANQIFGFEGVDAPEPEPQPTEMEELPLPSQSAAPQPDEIRSAQPQAAAPVLDDIMPPTLDDIAPVSLDDIVPPVLEDLSAPVLEEITPPVLEELSAPVPEETSIPVLDELSVPEVAAQQTVSADDFTDFEIPEVPVLNNISAVAAEEIEDISIPGLPVAEAAEETAEEIIEEVIEETVEEIAEEAAEETIEEISAEATEEIVEEITEETVEENVEEITEEAAEENVEKITEAPVIPEPVQNAAPIQPVPVQTAPPVQTIPPVQPIPVQTVPPVQPVPVQAVPPVQPVPVQAVPPVQPVPVQQPQIITVPQLAGYDAAGQPIYSYMQMQMTGYDQNGQPIYMPLGGQQPPIPPQAAVPQPRPMMGMSNTMGGQMGANIQKPFVQLDAPTQTPAYIKAKLGDQAANGQYVQPSANISKIAVNPHSKETSKAFVNAISNSKDYANKNLIETQGLRANTPVLSSIEDVLSQMGDNSLKNQKKAAQMEVNLGSEYKGSASRPSAPRTAPARKPQEDVRLMTKKELNEKKKQDKYAAKFKKDMAKRGF